MKNITKFILSISIISLIFLTSFRSVAQESKGTIKGLIKTSKNEPAENVSVSLKGTSYGSVTNDEGKFEIHAPFGQYILVVSHVGINSQEIGVNLSAGKVSKVPPITVDISARGLSEINISGNKTNKFVKRHSDDVAKTPLTNLENPQVYSTISNELITEQNITTVDAALSNAPGIQTMWNATGRSGDGGSYYNSRGFTLQSQLRNGISGNISSTVDAANIESIEVIKGPSATLFGSTLTSYGGLINRVTKKPYDDFGGEATYTVGSYGLNRLALDVNTPVDSAKKLLFRLNTAANYQGSFMDHGYSKSLVIDPSLIYKVNDRLSVSFDAEISTGKNIDPPIFFFYGPIADLGYNNANKLPVNYYRSYSAGDLSQQSRSDNFYGTLNYKISDHWKSQTDFSSTYSYSNGFGPYYYLLPHDSISRNDQSTRHSSQLTTEIQENINGEFYIGKFRNRFVGGLDFLRINSKQYYFGATYDTAPDNSSTFDYNSFNNANLSAEYASPSPLGYYPYPFYFKTNAYSAYVSDVFNVTDKLLFLAALRVDHFDDKGNYDPTAGTTSGAYKQTALSPKFGAVYQLVKDKLSLFANYQNGFTNEPGHDYQNKAFKPEEANQIEGGLKLDLFDGKLSGTVSYYRIRVQNVIRSYAPDPNFSIQDGTQISRGVEAEVIANPFTGFNIVSGFSYNYSVYSQASPDVQGRRPETASSPYTANLWMSYKLPQGTVKGLGFGFGGNFASNNVIINSESQGVFTLPEFVTLKADAFYNVAKYRISFGVNNLTDRKYWSGYTTVNPQMPRQFVGTIAYKF